MTPEDPSSLLTELSTPGADADVRDLNNAELSTIRTILNSSLYLFSRFICGTDILYPPFHGELCSYIEKWGTEGFDRIITQVPRDFLKSTVGTKNNALWQICREPHEPIVIFNESEENTKAWLNGIRNIASSSTLFQHVYRDLLPPGIARDDTRSLPRHWKWNDQHLDFEGRRIGEPEHSISGYGISSATVGHHWAKLILDDIIGLKHKRSAAEMAQVFEWVDHHIYLMRPAGQGLAYVNCTPWGYNDVYTHMCLKYNYVLYRRASLEKDRHPDVLNGTSTFPTRFTTQHLRNEYEKATDKSFFYAQRQCEPTPGKEQSFAPEWIRQGRIDYSDPENPCFLIHPSHYDPTIRCEPDATPPPQVIYLSQLRKACFLDPAPSEGSAERKREPSCRNGIWVEGIDPWGRRFILETLGLRDDPRTVIDTIFALAERWGFDQLFVEEVNFSKLYRFWFQDLQRPGQDHANTYLSIMPCKPGVKDKHERMRALIPGHKAGDYYYNTERCAEGIREVSEYPNCDTNDILDAGSYDYRLTPGLTPLQQERSSANTYQRQHSRCPWTGY